MSFFGHSEWFGKLIFGFLLLFRQVFGVQCLLLFVISENLSLLLSLIFIDRGHAANVRVFDVRQVKSVVNKHKYYGTDANEYTFSSHILNLSTLTSVCIILFSILFSMHFLRCRQGELSY